MPTGANRHTLKYQKGCDLDVSSHSNVDEVFGSAALWLFVGLVLAGCASAKVKELKSLQGKVQRPDQIIVYHFRHCA